VLVRAPVAARQTAAAAAAAAKLVTGLHAKTLNFKSHGQNKSVKSPSLLEISDLKGIVACSVAFACLAYLTLESIFESKAMKARPALSLPAPASALPTLRAIS
jgi:hypothetical protein